MMWRKLSAWLALLLWCATVTSAQTHTLEVFNTANSPLPENNIRALTFAPDSALWIGTENGLITLDNGTWEIIDTFINLPVRTIAFDSSGYAWVGTFLNGLWVQTDTGWVNYTTANSTLPDDYVRTIAFCPNGDAWLGTVAGAAHIANGTWTVYRESNTNWFTEHIASSYCTPDNEVWLGGINSGLMHQVDTGWVIYRTVSSNLPDNTILDIKSRPNGDLWLAMPAAGTATFDGNQQWIYYNTTTSFNPSNSINQIAIGNEGWVYFASINKGLVVYQGGLDWFHLSSTVQPDTSGIYLPTDELYSVTQAPDGTIWASGNNEGLFHITFWETTAVPLLNTAISIPLYPNPATDYFMVETTSPQLQVTITDIAGRTIHQETTTRPQTKVPLGNLPKGTYIVILQSPDGVATQRLVKD